MSAADVHKAIYNGLKADTRLLEILGGSSIYDSFRSDRLFPFVLIGDITAVDWSNDTNFGNAFTVVLHCWSTNKGRKQIYAVADRITDVMTTGLTATSDRDCRFILSQPLTSRFERDVPARATKATLRFRILAEPAN